MQMLRQQHKGVNNERMSRFNDSERRTQQFDVIRLTEEFASAEGHDGEKVSSSRSFGATIVHDEGSPNVGRATAFRYPATLTPENGMTTVKHEIRRHNKY